MSDRTDAFGRAFAGSQLQIQTYVNRRRKQLNAAILEALPELLQDGATLEWVSPLEEERFSEYFDESFLAAVGLLDLAGELANFWPQGGPHWDGLAKIHWADSRPSGVLLAEAKSCPKEMYSAGCLASEGSRRTIIKSLDAARAWLRASGGDWTGPLYQMANRLAHLYFLSHVCGVPAYLVNIYFCGDPHSPTPAPVWKNALAEAKQCLGINGQPIPHFADVLIDAAGRELFQVAPGRQVLTVAAVAHGPGKEWRFLRNERTGRHQFLAFANARGSSSLRYFDCDSGLLIGMPRYGHQRDYQEAFATELSATVPVTGPRAVSIDRIPPEELARMRAQVGLESAPSQSTGNPSRSSILAGVDEIVDQALGLTGIGNTAPHYRHLTAFRKVASCPIDGPVLIEKMYTRIVSNWPGTRCRSNENWRWEKKTYISERNESPEKRFEKALATLGGEWYNMIPVASGVLPDVEEGGRRIDLARQIDLGWFELIELKLGDNCATPLYAAIEIICYGLLYIFSRTHAQPLGYDSGNLLLSARHISLKVLAPANRYSGSSLERFESEINRGLKALVDMMGKNSFEIDFTFEELLPESGSALERIAGRRAVYRKI